FLGCRASISLSSYGDIRNGSEKFSWKFSWNRSGNVPEIVHVDIAANVPSSASCIGGISAKKPPAGFFLFIKRT
ncbi:MAG: hypothetical protein FWC70_12105, partial [Defluviitaleaceae bacterium]|nr:hypothetical protein [Defluviitaleaceae bacterium]